MKENDFSYVSAGSIPWKLLQLKEIAFDKNGGIVPLHLQLIPTNQCNGMCSWCSCSKVDRTLTMSKTEAFDILKHFSKLGTRAVTITGGGEPTLHPDLPLIVNKCVSYGIRVGLSTNGIRWSSEGIDPQYSNSLEWIRISIIQSDVDKGQDSIIENIVSQLPGSSIGISLTVDHQVSVRLANRLAGLVRETANITHMRIVQNILDPDDAVFDDLRWVLKSNGSCDKIIFQRRSKYEAGMSPCLISLLKPMVDVDGSLYPCCGVQYASGDENELRKMPLRFRMGNWSDYPTKPFDGRICKKCYYGDYNRVLKGLTTPLRHIFHV